MLTVSKDIFLKRFDYNYNAPIGCSTVDILYSDGKFKNKFYNSKKELIKEYIIRCNTVYWMNFTLEEKAYNLLQKGEKFHCDGNEYIFLDCLKNYMQFFCTVDKFDSTRPYCLSVGVDETDVACELLLDNPWGLRLCCKDN